jgi:hypothetical protein
VERLHPDTRQGAEATHQAAREVEAKAARRHHDPQRKRHGPGITLRQERLELLQQTGLEAPRAALDPSREEDGSGHPSSFADPCVGPGHVASGEPPFRHRTGTSISKYLKSLNFHQSENDFELHFQKGYPST